MHQGNFVMPAQAGIQRLFSILKKKLDASLRWHDRPSGGIIHLILTLLFTLPAYALPNDTLQKLYITADFSSYNSKTSTTLFVGNVNVNQGTTHLTADRLTTKSNSQHKMEEVIAYGSKDQAHYWTTRIPEELPTHAKANLIKFYPLQSLVKLEGNVILTQGENSFQGPFILYNMQDQVVTVPSSKEGRAVLIYNPDK